MNRTGEQVRAAGLIFCYHNHAFEFGGTQGQRPIDIYKSNLDKTLVKFEIDVFWVSVTGNDPVAILKEFAGQVPLVHLKDKARGTPVRYDERVTKESFQEKRGSGKRSIFLRFYAAPRLPAPNTTSSNRTRRLEIQLRAFAKAIRVLAQRKGVIRFQG